MSVPGYSDLERGVKSAWDYATSWIFTSGPHADSVKTKGTSKATPAWGKPLWGAGSAMIPPAAGIFVRLAGVSGAAAVILGAYGAHALKPVSPEAKEVFETGNRYHLMHSIALGLVPLSRYPRLTGPLFMIGMLGFCGGCYGYALAQHQMFRQMTPYGGICLILAWLSMVL